jgi:hypothetical protein
MSHFAKIENGLVTKVIVAEKDFFEKFIDDSPGIWLQTSYNMRGGIYYDPNSNIPADPQPEIASDDGRRRKNYAGVGFTYNHELDAFIPPQPYPSWVLNEETCLWNSPVPYPTDGQVYIWNEENTVWEQITE